MAKMTKIQVVCAWCGKDMGEKDGQGQEGVSHGMCDECYEAQRKKRPSPQAEKKAGDGDKASIN